MANKFLTIKEVARQALPRLIENLVFPNLIYKDFSDTFQKKGASPRSWKLRSSTPRPAFPRRTSTTARP